MMLQSGFGSVDPIVFVKYDRALEIINVKLQRYGAGVLSKIKGLLGARKKLKNNQNLIESQLVLKILL